MQMTLKVKIKIKLTAEKAWKLHILVFSMVKIISQLGALQYEEAILSGKEFPMIISLTTILSI